jgi:hypothetical protein
MFPYGTFLAEGWSRLFSPRMVGRESAVTSSSSLASASASQNLSKAPSENLEGESESREEASAFCNLPNYLAFGFCQAYEYHGQHTFARSRDRRPTIWKCKRYYWTCSTASARGNWTRESSWPLRTDVMVLDTEKFSYKHSSSHRTVA